MVQRFGVALTQRLSHHRLLSSFALCMSTLKIDVINVQHLNIGLVAIPYRWIDIHSVRAWSPYLLAQAAVFSVRLAMLSLLVL